jgi:beta-lactamase class A
MQRHFFIYVGVLIAGACAGFAVAKFMPIQGRNLASPNQEVREGAYKFINPLLECNGVEDAFAELKTFKGELQDYADSLNRASNGVDFISVYFRDLNNGPWFGVNEDANFNPASLLKLPIAFIYFKEAENDPAVLEQGYRFEDDGMLPQDVQTVKPSQQIQFGTRYTVRDLIKRMLMYSDNYAQHVLVKNINLDVLKKVYDDFSMQIPAKNNPATSISVVDYSRFFRVLYNASYLDKRYSEEVLEYLAASQFKDGLVAGVPSDIAVAHKFGERQQGGDGTRQFHDCGIVYYPKHPYLLCVMTRGNDNKVLEEVIKNISSFVYGAVSSQYMGQ